MFWQKIYSYFNNAFFKNLLHLMPHRIENQNVIRTSYFYAFQIESLDCHSNKRKEPRKTLFNFLRKGFNKTPENLRRAIFTSFINIDNNLEFWVIADFFPLLKTTTFFKPHSQHYTVQLYSYKNSMHGKIISFYMTKREAFKVS